MDIDTNPAEEARAVLFKDLPSRSTLRAALGKDGKPVSDRTIARLIAAGCPVVKFGKTDRFDLGVVRQWIVNTYTRVRSEPRARGRPRGRAA